ncbi:MAG: dihydrolipoamide acetyltransferase family protein [Bowdeniella nasicola]|nr:dihydrolipoamide acetyltransferase family protein [Bowdeniella nasicola]
MRREFLLPDPGEGLTEATIVHWYVEPGQAVQTNDTIVEIETAKSSVELPSPWEGTVAEILVPEGTEVKVGAPILAIDTVGEDAPAGAQPDDAHTGAGRTESEGAILVGYGTGGSARRAARSRPPRVLAKPPVRKLAKDLGIDLTTVHASGPGGIVTREDVQHAAERQEAKHLATYPHDAVKSDRPWLDGGTVSRDGRETRVPVQSVRRRTAEAMVASAFTAPHVTVFETVDVTPTMELLQELRALPEFRDVRLTPLVLVMKALLMAVRRHPQINASWDEERREIVYKHYVNLGIAASTPRGLMVPNIKDAHRLSLLELARELATLTTRARSGATSLTELSQGTVTITNIGVFGIDSGTPILNPGEAAILAFGAVKKQPWVHEGEVVARDVTTLALSFDHRLVDGELGSRVLSEVATLLHNPALAFAQ